MKDNARRCWVGALMLALTACRSGNGAAEQAENGDRPVDPPENRTTVSRYCEDFANTYSESEGLDYRADSASAERSSDVRIRLQNAFQPADSRFTAGYVCRFRATDGADVRSFTVRIYLTKTRSFAKHTQWEDLQLVPIRHVVDETDDREGYGVFKYLRDR